MVKKKKKKTVSKKKVAVKKKKKTVTKKKKAKVALMAAPKVTKNYLMMVLDESSSMDYIKEQAISAFNEQIKSVKENTNGIEVVVDLVKFSSEVSVVFENQKIDTVQELTKETYNPNTMTSMYDGVGKAIELLKARPDINDPSVTVLMLIISDGQENTSRIWTAPKVAEQIKTLQATGKWTFTYAGANQDLSVISQTLNIPIGNTSAFAATAAGMNTNNSLRTKSTRELYTNYSLGSRSVSNFYNASKEDTTSNITNKTK